MVTRFTFIGGALCLDFANTVGGHDGSKILRDKMAGPADLKRWASQAGLKTDGITPRVFRRAITLRETLYRICVSAVQGKPPTQWDMEVFNRELRIARSAERLRFRDGEFRFESQDIAVIGAVVRSAVDILTGDLSRLRVCGGDGCAWLFLDTSRNRSRQWCEMSVCGNRAKARSFRARAGVSRRFSAPPRPHVEG